MTLLAVYWLDGPSRETQPAPADDELSHSEMAATERARSEATTATPGSDAESIGSADAEEPVHVVSAEAERGDAPLSSQGSVSETATQGLRPPTSNPEPATQGTTGDSPYPPEIAEMIEKSVDKELQAQYENDQREDSWAAYMEGLLSAYFAQQPSLAQFYISLIDCRTSICSIHAIGYGPDALTQWNLGTADLVGQPWFEFNNMSMNRRNPAPDILAIVLIVTKNPSS